GPRQAPSAQGSVPHHHGGATSARGRPRCDAVSRRPEKPPREAPGHDRRAAELVALDFETTGLDPRSDDVISFGLIPVSGGRIDLSGARYQEVAPRVEPRHSSIRVHHPRTQDLAPAPPMAEVADAFREGLAGRFIL